jgi:hypothetical protein
MSSNLAIHLMIYAFMGRMLWKLILKKSAYPESVPTRVKWMHALILFYVLTSVWDASFQLFWLLHYPAEIINCLTSQPNLMGQPSVGAAVLLQITAAFPLFFICSKMARRETKMLKWFFLLWPILFMSETYVAIIHQQGHIRTGSIVIGTILATIFGFAAMIFYLLHSSKVLFKEQNSHAVKLV